ncbi:hypothetical protein D2T31_12085 [Sinirhodobacter populi]|uniref:Uncharacterized protein n=1 Tax=Paenirhodobacter populi TaxID=2306993 RepID=A0A443K7W3_9RHOB|nr:hypothetical protein [Sinirhodobacter populi]RWR28845.1 hypothetical protein D2T31_12085 [Sinirhodobacter populi]
MASSQHNDTPAQINRRSVLTAALAAPLAAVPAVAVAADTPVMALFREWVRLSALMDGGEVNDELVDDYVDQRGDLEIKIASTKAETPMDALMKVCAITDFGFYGNGDHGLPEAWAEARALVGQPA